MTSTNLNQVYEAIGSLTQAVEGLRRDIQTDRTTAIESQRKADASRANVHKRLDDLVGRTQHLESEVSTVKNDVQAVNERTIELQTVTDDVKVMRNKAQGAGALGRILMKIGGWLLSAAAGVVGAWYWFADRFLP